VLFKHQPGGARILRIADMKKFKSYLLVSVLLLFQGCLPQKDSPTDAIPLGSHKVTVTPRCITKEINNSFPDKQEIYDLTCGNTNVVIKNEELIVNGKSYGMLKAGDSVEVNSGRVLVNSRQADEVGK
jgi:hypothetical protein